MRDLSTELIHHPYTPPAGFAAPQAGVFKASTVIFANVAAMRKRDWKHKTGYTYGLHGTPTTFLLEERLCSLEGGSQCLLQPSGLAAIATVAMALLKTGDEVLIPDNAYGPNKALAEGELQAWGITHRLYDPMDPADLAGKISEKTRLVWLEAPGSVTLEFPDLPELVRACRARNVVCALDNTWGTGLAFRPFDLTPGSGGAPLGVDISVQALTKYPSGGGDVLMGSVITRDEALHLKIKMTQMRLGLGVGGNDVEAVLRSLPSIALRYRAHDAATRELAQWCLTRKEFSQVLHPALAGSPGHAHWRALCTGELGSAAGLFSVMLDPRYSSAQVDAFCDALQLFKLGYSWGGPMSLVVPYELAAMRSQWPAGLERGTLVRFSVGLEAVADLRADMARALETALA
jgi:cysteine-S-conjugate beta-lyase